MTEPRSPFPSGRPPKTRVKRNAHGVFVWAADLRLIIEFRLAALRDPERPENAHGVFVWAANLHLIIEFRLAAHG